MRKFKSISILLILVFFVSSVPVCAFGATPNSVYGGTVTIFYGESAEEAGVTLTLSNTTPKNAWAEGSTYPVRTYNDDFEIGYLASDDKEYVFFKKTDYSEEYQFLYWWYTGPNGESGQLPRNIDGEWIVIGDSYGEKARIGTYYRATNMEASMAGAEAACVITWQMYTQGDWTIEPVFAKVSPYTVYLVNKGADSVDKGETVSLDLAVDGGAYDDLSAIITYDSDLFIYESCSNDKITVDETSNGTLKLTATDLSKDEDDEAGTLVFTAKATATASSGTFSVTGAKVGTSLEAVSEDALETKKGENVTIGVNPATQVTIKFFNDWIGTAGEEYGLLTYVTLGNDSPDIVLEGVIYEYDAENYVYTFDTQGLDYQLTTYAGRNAIKIIKPDRDLIVKVSRTAVVPGELTTRQFTVGASVYTIATFACTADEGNTLFYDGEQMVKTSEGYICIIGGADTAATKTKITQETGTDLVMTMTGDVNQTGVIDINDAQLVSDLYNGKYTDGFNTVAMVKYLAADVNGDGAVTATDIAAVVQNSGFVY